MFTSDTLETALNFVFTLRHQKNRLYTPLRGTSGRLLHPIFGVITGPAWEAIAEPTLPRSLPSIAYPESPVGRLPEPGIHQTAHGFRLNIWGKEHF